MRLAFSILWVCNAIVGAVVLLFFLIGVADGTVSSFNARIWAALIAVVFAVVTGSLWLRSAGRLALGISLLLVLALPAIGFTLFMLAVIVSGESWN